MNRLWIGIVLLTLLLVVGIGFLWGSVVFFGGFSRTVEESGELALAGDWTTAGNKIEEVQRKWETYRRFWASFTDHVPVEQVESMFSQLELYRTQRRNVEYASVCRALAYVAEAMEESHGLRWWSLL